MCLPQPDNKEQLLSKATIIIIKVLLIYLTLGIDASERKSEEYKIATYSYSHIRITYIQDY
jgi:hypothetical protein